MLKTAWALVAVLLSCSVASAQSVADQTAPSVPTPGYAWVELVAGGTEIRAVAAAARCPDAIIDGRPTPMQVRAPATKSFALTVCKLRVPDQASQALVNGAPLPLPKRAPQRILIFGDTGCRLKGELVQDCNNPRAWPFAEVARRAAAQKPDLVIHVGDYYYRETPCPAGHAGCAGSPYGDNWGSWEAEFFAPARPLLASSPWVFVRGNHESCARGGGGWFRLLDASTPARACPDPSAPFTVDAGGLNLYVLDSADSDDRAPTAQSIQAFSAQLDTLKDDLARGEGWILTHRPIWALAPVARLAPFGPMEVSLNKTEQAAVPGHDLAGVQMVVSGHVHHFASFSFGPGRPAQLVAGTGGDIGDDADSRSLRSRTIRIDGLDAQSLSFERFGYLLLDRKGDDWTGAFRDLDDRIVATCRLHARALTCARPEQTPLDGDRRR